MKPCGPRYIVLMACGQEHHRSSTKHRARAANQGQRSTAFNLAGRSEVEVHTPQWSGRAINLAHLGRDLGGTVRAFLAISSRDVRLVFVQESRSIGCRLTLSRRTSGFCEVGCISVPLSERSAERKTWSHSVYPRIKLFQVYVYDDWAFVATRCFDACTSNTTLMAH